MRHHKRQATQLEIARRVGLDVSSVNKILGQKRGPKFHEDTITKVFETAKAVGYDFSKPSKSRLVAFMREILPDGMSDQTIAQIRGLSVSKVRRYRELLRRAEGA